MWVDMNGVTGEQTDLEKTVQQLITPLLAVVQKQMSLNRKLNISCIDSEKVFYSIVRKLLWPILQ